ncbi:MAG: AmmeMemoRadiSam system protein B [Chloroflexota bacterium]|nr:AmmeMemoRadiSam system protein B [Chloroflexota bacterium]
MAQVRFPAVAGMFYPSQGQALREEVAWCYRHPLGPGVLPTLTPVPLSRPLGLIAPHAGYRFSGPIAAHAYRALAQAGRPQGVVVLGPDHYGLGAPLSLSEACVWRTPLGDTPVLRDLDAPLGQRLPDLRHSLAGHLREHAVEVHLPFLQHLLGNTFPFLPIAVLDQSLAVGVRLGQALAEVLSPQGWVLIASTDLSHYYPEGRARQLDQRVLEAILTGKAQAVAEVAQEVNMCGPGPVIALLACLAVWGTPRPLLLAYATSADTGGGRERVVGYASFSVGVE